MIDLKEKPTARLDISRLSHPVNQGTLTLSNYVDRSGNLDSAPFWTSGALALKCPEPLPAAHKVAAPAPRRRAVSEIADINSIHPIAAPSSNVKASFAPYIAVAIFLSVAAGEGALLATRTLSEDGVASMQASATQGATEIATLLSPSASSFDNPQVQSAPVSMAEGEDWPETVGRFKQLLAQEQTARAVTMRQADNDRLLNSLDAWLKAKTR